ncbi:MAG: hypothetical protein CMJ18_05075 [Phycisphaeraceae bacterium]|nr:hypothetical protein [Phycisphaeraceae bacterium]
MQAYLFEFMDLPWLAQSLRLTLRDILECVCSRPLRPYYDWVARRVLATLREGDTVVELAAGTAPIARHLARMKLPDRVRLIVADLNPDHKIYEELSRRHPGVIEPETEPVDLMVERDWGQNATIVLSAAFHHIPFEKRGEALGALSRSAGRVMIFEPLRHQFASPLLVLTTLIPSLLLPLWYLGRRAGSVRRFLWCWLVPIAPLIFWWEGIISCLRCWSERTWRKHLGAIAPDDRTPVVEHTLFSTYVSW